MRTLTSMALCLFLISVAPVAQCGTVHVPGDEPTIQAGIDAAADGDTVLVAPGTYAEGILIDGRRIAVRSEVGSYATVIDAAGLPIGVWLLGDLGPTTTVTGFTVQNALTAGIFSGNGASPTLVDLVVAANIEHGLLSSLSSPMLSDCLFHSNGAYGLEVRGGGPTASGCTFIAEGVHVSNAAHATLADCDFRGKAPAESRPVRSPGVLVGAAHITATRCTFEEYQGMSALRLYDNTAPASLQNCTFTDNSGDLGSAIYGEGASLVATGCTFSSNSSTENGGAVVLRWGDAACFVDCVFVGNYTPGLGGGISTHGIADVDFIGCEFQGNTSGEDGGGLRSYGPEGCDILVDHCLFVGNSCDGTGSATRLSDCSGTVVNCTMVDCASPPDGGAIHVGGAASNMTISECIVASGEGYGISISDGTPFPYILYCDVFEMSSGPYAPPLPDVTGVYGNISADPMFCDPEEGNYLLDENSPCATGGSGGDYIGAFGVGCGGTAVHDTSWGAIKAMFR